MMGVSPDIAVDIPDVDDYEEGAWCPRCNQRLVAVGTPQVPISLLVDDQLVLELQEADVETIPAFGWKCDRHRLDIVLPAPHVVAPDRYEPVDADFDGDEITLAVPEPVLEEVTDSW